MRNYKELYNVMPEKLYKSIVLKLNRPSDGIMVRYDISVDIVPVIHIHGWWPAGGYTVDDETRSEGCNFVFDQPHQRYSVPYTQIHNYVKISFARAEGIFLRSNPIVRAAYIVARRLWWRNRNQISSTVLKSAALWSDTTMGEMPTQIISLRRPICL